MRPCCSKLGDFTWLDFNVCIWRFNLCISLMLVRVKHTGQPWSSLWRELQGDHSRWAERMLAKWWTYTNAELADLGEEIRCCFGVGLLQVSKSVPNLLCACQYGGALRTGFVRRTKQDNAWQCYSRCSAAGAARTGINWTAFFVSICQTNQHVSPEKTDWFLQLFLLSNPKDEQHYLCGILASLKNVLVSPVSCQSAFLNVV